MSGRALWDPVVAAFRGEQLKPTIVLFLSPFLMVTWKYFGDPKYLAAAIPEACVLFADRSATGAVYSFAASFVLLGLIPALVVWLVFRERLADYGVRFGDRVRTVRSALILCPCFLLAAYLGSGDPAVRAHYPLNPSAGASPAMFAVHAASYLLFYLGWEFHFRGFLQIGLRQRLGDANALLVQVLASGVLHIGRPASETYLSFFAGLLWGILAFRTRSLLSGLLQHSLLGISLDWFLCQNG
jgi:membrane protease YdiL (CAAX protease family)